MAERFVGAVKLEFDIEYYRYRRGGSPQIAVICFTRLRINIRGGRQTATKSGENRQDDD